MIYPVILGGGSGSRLWPMSRSTYPKQFVNLGGGRTLFKEAVNRSIVLLDQGEKSNILVVTNYSQQLTAQYELGECNVVGKILVEPSRRNTAAAIASAAFYAYKQCLDAILFVLPSDQFIEDQGQFKSVAKKAIGLAHKEFLVTFGIKPTSAETGYGYIKAGKNLIDGGFKVDKFVEKPNLQTAEHMLETGDYYWNSGIFVFRAEVFLGELNKYAPEIYDAVNQSVQLGTETEKSFILDKNSFEQSPSLAVDYAVMEKTNKGAVIPLVDSQWKDLGSWKSFYDVGEKDSNGNVRQGDVILNGCSNSYIRSTKRVVAAIGVSNLAIIETQDAVLVSALDKTQEVREIVAILESSNREEANLHPLVFRPWGSYENLTRGNKFRVKRIVVQPGEELSLQLHHHRAEHWIVVEGTAEVQIADKIKILRENESIFVPLGAVHRLRNTGEVPLVVIEVQSGTYLEEDDIVRLADKYNRY